MDENRGKLLTMTNWQAMPAADAEPALASGKIAHSNDGDVLACPLEGAISLKPLVNNREMFRLDGKIAVVSGGASGIGRAICETFAARGASVHILDLNANQSEAVAAGICNLGGRAMVHVCDVTRTGPIERVFRHAIPEASIDILVNSAGVPHIGKLEDTTEEDLDRIFEVNVKGTYNCMRACIGSMKTQGGGVILNIASIASSCGIPDRFAYSMSKGAVLAMTYSVARDYLDFNIRCNCISPARIHTPFVDGFVQKNYPGREQEVLAQLSRAQPIGRMGEPWEVAALALFLCSKEASFITGADYPLDGGFLNLR
jgi:2-keto-3-deoxy-L-fuconate dehydrogenase